MVDMLQSQDEFADGMVQEEKERERKKNADEREIKYKNECIFG
jgi:hypothetical protein